MDRPILVDSRGGIVTPATPYPGSHYAPSIQVWSPDIAAYVETVMIPSAVVSSTAIFDGRPDDLVRVTYTSGAALTFFVDSVAGGDDSSGKGSADDPWRSLNTASNFIKCAECILNTACEYIQIKVKGTVDYVSGNWNPKYYHPMKLILTGWDGVCDLGSSGVYHAGYFKNVKATEYGDAGTVHSGGVVYGGGASSTAIDCEVPSDRYVGFFAAVNCFGGSMSASYVKGGRYEYANVGQAVSIHVSRNLTSYAPYHSAYALLVGPSGAVYRASAYITADVSSADGAVNASAVAIAGNAYGTTLIDCSATAHAYASGSRQANAYAAALFAGNAATVVSGGSFYARTSASASGSNSANVYTYAVGVAGTVHNAATTVSATASTEVDTTIYNASRIESETVVNAGQSCAIHREYLYRGGSIYSSGVTSAGELC